MNSCSLVKGKLNFDDAFSQTQDEIERDYVKIERNWKHTANNMKFLATVNSNEEDVLMKYEFIGTAADKELKEKEDRIKDREDQLSSRTPHKTKKLRKLKSQGSFKRSANKKFGGINSLSIELGANNMSDITSKKGGNAQNSFKMRMAEHSNNNFGEFCSKESSEADPEQEPVPIPFNELYCFSLS
mmetsp:Transcript_1722/g.2159  ORF Transcript_1722/g.2159 Transcript_1722/m.2159 type:complete len:186 (-) Transcript_1722:33-590(-)